MQKLRTWAVGVSAGLAVAFAATGAAADGYARGGLKDQCCDSWTGFYLGIHGGYGWKDNDFREFLGIQTPQNTQVFVGGIDSKGWLFGGHAGYNWQRGALVGGLELDLSSTSIDGVSAPAVFTFVGGGTDTHTRGDDVKWLGSARARLGFAPGGCCSNFLFYGTGGLAWERFERTNTSRTITPNTNETDIRTTPNDRFGWVAGLGAEAKLGGTGWIGRLEYLHYEFGTSETTQVVISPGLLGGNRLESAKDQTIDVLRAGLSYKF